MSDFKNGATVPPAEEPARVIRTADGWTFSADMSDEAMADIRGLIAINGLAHAAPPDGAIAFPDRTADDAAAADAAFARMVAAHPTATVVEGTSAPAAPGGGAFPAPERTEAEQAEADAAFERMLAANPGAREIIPGVYSTAAPDPHK